MQTYYRSVLGNAHLINTYTTEGTHVNLKLYSEIGKDAIKHIIKWFDIN